MMGSEVVEYGIGTDMLQAEQEIVDMEINICTVEARNRYLIGSSRPYKNRMIAK